MKPTVVLVGRPNVGKSTLFNRLTRSRDAIVHDLPGLTRDRHYGQGQVGGKPYIVVDTGGLEALAKDGIVREMARQTLQAVDEADAVVMLVDARQGLTSQDQAVAQQLRRTGRRLWLAVNKSEGIPTASAAADFHALGLGDPLPVSAAHGEGVRELMELVLAALPEAPEEPPEQGRGHPRIAVVGRPNVGKSTLVNALVGEERVIAFDEPGTTRDSIDVEFQRDGRTYTLVDTAGVRRRGKVREAVEKFSVLKTLRSIEDANVVILVLDARQDISEQDAHLAGFVLEAGRALVVAVNKWDGLEADARERIKRDYARKLGFLDFARVHHISALRGSGLGALLRSADAAYAAAMVKLSTPKLTRVLLDAVASQAPPRAGLSRPKLRYAHQGGSNPPVIVIHGNALEELPDSYRRFLERRFIDAFELQGTPLRIRFRTTKNPFVDKPS